MSLILNIDTSTETASVCIAEDGIAVSTISNPNQKSHAAFLHKAIGDIVEKNSLNLKLLSAIAVTNGPGSYTGLRVGMASAKGFCYALNKPLITVGSLELMAHAMIRANGPQQQATSYCPLIDARRMEVYTALYDGQMNELSAPEALILNENSFEEILNAGNVCFSGNGAGKFAAILSHKNAQFLTIAGVITAMAKLSFERLKTRNFADLIDSEPLYLKDFHSSPDFFNKK